jgi:ABC-type sugar transport system substrate-binding protein
MWSQLRTTWRWERRKRFRNLRSRAAERDRWLSIPFLGCDGVSKPGQAWVRSGILAATVIAPPLAGQALEMLTHALQTQTAPPEVTLVAPRSFPALESRAALSQPGKI